MNEEEERNNRAKNDAACCRFVFSDDQTEREADRGCLLLLVCHIIYLSRVKGRTISGSIEHVPSAVWCYRSRSVCPY